MREIYKSVLIILLTTLMSQGVFAQTKKVLFIGNSYTSANNLPQMVYNVALSLGDTISFDSYSPGGQRFLNHASNPTTLAKINAQNWDFVVLQAQSQEPSFPPSQVEEQLYPYAEQLNAAIKANHACSETVFYMTWGRKFGDQQNCAGWPPVCTFEGMQQRLMVGYMTMAMQNDATVSPVGLAWKQAMDNDPTGNINLYSGDNSHPSVAGTYLTACVMYATLFQKSLVGTPYTAGVSANVALFLQQTASEVVLGEDYNYSFNDPYTALSYNLGWQSWFELGNIAIAGFSHQADAATYSFIDESLNGETYGWDFGDNSTSTLAEPVHTYSNDGTYLVEQTVSNNCFEAIARDTLNLTFTGLNHRQTEAVVSVFPNPGNGIFNLTIHSEKSYATIVYRVFDSVGKAVAEGSISGEGKVANYPVDLSDLGAGLYRLNIRMGDESLTKALVIQ